MVQAIIQLVKFINGYYLSHVCTSLNPNTNQLKLMNYLSLLIQTPTQLISIHYLLIQILLFHFTSAMKYSRPTCLCLYNGSPSARVRSVWAFTMASRRWAIVNTNTDRTRISYLLLVYVLSVIFVDTLWYFDCKLQVFVIKYTVTWFHYMLLVR